MNNRDIFEKEFMSEDFTSIHEGCWHIELIKALGLKMNKMPFDKFKIFQQELSELLLRSEMSCLRDNMIVIPDRLFFGYHLCFLQEPNYFRNSWIFYSSEEMMIREIYCTSELFDKNILSNELRGFLIKNIDLFDGI